MFYEEDNNYLAHYGVKGQKWGVRRYQNEDGSLTSEGKLHYYGDKKREIINNRSKPASARIGSLPQGATKIKQHKKISQMTNQELQAQIDRMNLEKRYKDLKRDLKGKGGENKNNNGDNNKNKKGLGGTAGLVKKSYLLSTLDRAFVQPAAKAMGDRIQKKIGLKFADIDARREELRARQAQRPQQNPANPPSNPTPSPSRVSTLRSSWNQLRANISNTPVNSLSPSRSASRWTSARSSISARTERRNRRRDRRRSRETGNELFG